MTIRNGKRWTAATCAAVGMASVLGACSNMPEELTFFDATPIASAPATPPSQPSFDYILGAASFIAKRDAELGHATQLEIGAEAVVLAAVTDYAPLSDKDAPGGGVAVEVTREAFAQLGLLAVFDFVSPTTGLEGVDDGRYEAVGPISRARGREAGLAYSIPVYEDVVLAFYNADARIEATGLADFRGKRVCRPSVGQRFNFVEDLVGSGAVELIAPESLEACAKLLAAGRVDVLFELETAMLGAVTKLGLEKRIAPSRTIFDIVQLSIVFPNDDSRSQELMRRFDEVLAAMRAEGRYMSLVAQELASNGYAAMEVRIGERSFVRARSDDVWADGADSAVSDPPLAEPAAQKAQQSVSSADRGAAGKVALDRVEDRKASQGRVESARSGREARSSKASSRSGRASSRSGRASSRSGRSSSRSGRSSSRSDRGSSKSDRSESVSDRSGRR